MRIAGQALVLIALTMMSSAAWAQRGDDDFIGQKAPELKGGDVWINSTPLTMESLRGKVVLIEFWAFDCPNCAEAMPHVMELHNKYSRDGLVVIGVHTPRIDREKVVGRVREAVKSRGIPYPVVVDNQYSIWGDYACDAWPNLYVVDQEGTIRLSHTGVGRYDDLDKVIQKLLSKKSGK